MDSRIQGVKLTPLKKIAGENGSVFHILRNDADEFAGFGEVYISTINGGHKKNWRRHKEMTLNIAVPVGKIKFVLFDDKKKVFDVIILSSENYYLMTVPPGIWMAFEGLAAEESYLVNVASIPHDPSEADILPLENDLIPYEWE